MGPKDMELNGLFCYIILQSANYVFNMLSILLAFITAALYIHIVFGFNHKPGQPPKQLAFSTKGYLHFENGSFYVGHNHVHHWVFYWSLAPIFLCYSCTGCGVFALLMGLHGFCYPDRFELA